MMLIGSEFMVVDELANQNLRDYQLADFAEPKTVWTALRFFFNQMFGLRLFWKRGQDP